MSKSSDKIDEPRIVDANSMQFLGLRKAYKAPDPQGFSEQWQQFAPHIGKIPGQTSRVAYGIVLDAANGVEYVTAVEAPLNADSNGDMALTRLPAMKYAAFTHPGDVTTIRRTVDAAYRKWLPSSGYQAAEQPSLIERYGEKFDPATSSGDIEVWIPLKS